MSTTKAEIQSVPTNIITGFLGVGKTSTIMQLLQNKPENERWAVLVNEFGEIGVDGSLLQGQDNKAQVFIREVPGGCMCCAAGVPMQVALNQLLKESKPDRLLIEPTGLGHPKEILQVLSSEHYQNVLRLQKTITLVDARQLSDSRYTEHDTFNQQIAIADIVVGNKQDLYQQADYDKLQSYVEGFKETTKQVVFAKHGQFSSALLAGNIENVSEAGHHHHHGHSKPLAAELPMPESGMIKAQNHGEGFTSLGWRFCADKVFNEQALDLLLTDLPFERLKAVFITDNGVIGYNSTHDGLQKSSLTQASESRIEIILRETDEGFENLLLATIK